MDPAALQALPPEKLIEWAIQRHRERFAVVTSFQAEGMVIADMAVRIDPKVRVVTIDTGRLPEETHELIDAFRERYRVAVEVVVPDAGEVERMVALHGVNLFRREPVFRKLCCHVRKVRPLDRVLGELDAWATGLRRGQSEERQSVEKVQHTHGRLKLNPLADWSAEQVEDYVSRNGLLRHPLTARGYSSIGCGPCTRAVKPGEPERAGRWWWEEGMSKECGLHAAPDGTVRRAMDVLLSDILGN
jgi:phosphoadenylyl-sulfate reductase (thioredoxin)